MGRGQLVDVSLLDNSIATLAYGGAEPTFAQAALMMGAITRASLGRHSY